MKNMAKSGAPKLWRGCMPVVVMAALAYLGLNPLPAQAVEGIVEDETAAVVIASEEVGTIQASDAAKPTADASANDGSMIDASAVVSVTTEQPTTISDDCDASTEGQDQLSDNAGALDAEDETPSEDNAQASDCQPVVDEDAVPQDNVDDAVPQHEEEQACDAEDDATPANVSADEQEHADMLQAADSKRPLEDGTYVFKSDLGMFVINAAGKKVKAGSNVAIASYAGTAAQKWEVVYDEAAEAYRLYVSGSSQKLALGVTKNGSLLNAGVVSATAKATLQSLLWSFVEAGSGSYHIQSVAYDGYCLDVAQAKAKAGTNVLLWKQNPSDVSNQRFAVLDAKPSVAAGTAGLDGAYLLVLDDNSAVVADVCGASKANGANVLLYKKSGNANQRVYLEQDSHGYYTAWLVGSGKVLDVAGGSVLPGANVLQWTGKGSDNQKWAVVASTSADGTQVVSLQNKATGLFLGATFAASGANLVGVAAGAADAYATFRLVSCELLSSGVYEIKPRTSTKVSLDVKGATARNDVKGSLLLYTDTNALNQRFELVKAQGDNNWRVRTASSGGWLTYDGGNSLVQAGQGDDEETAATTWHATFAGGWFGLINVASGKALDMTGGKTKSGTVVGVWTPNGKDSQHFTFAAATLWAGEYVTLQSSAGGYLKAGSKAGAAASMSTTTTALAQCFHMDHVDGGWLMRDYNGRYLTESAGQLVSKASAANYSSQCWQIAIADGGKLLVTNTTSGDALALSGTTPALIEASAAQLGWKLIDRTVYAMKERIAQVAIHFAEHNVHGYSIPNRGKGGTETITVQDGTKVKICKSDVDCSEMVRNCVNSVLGYNAISYLDTRNMDKVLKAHGFVRIAYKTSKVQRGDILWCYGHTGVALGDKKQADAHGDEYGGLSGPNKGDQTGHEVEVRALRTSVWTYIYRYVG